MNFKKKYIGYICLGLMLVGCHNTPTENITQADTNIVDLVDTVICKSYSFIGDSIVDTSTPIVYSFDYDDCGKLISYRKDNSEPIAYNPQKGCWNQKGKLENNKHKTTFLHLEIEGDEMIYTIWDDIANLSSVFKNGMIDSISVGYDNFWKRNTNVDFSNLNGWICTGYEETSSTFQINTIIEYYPSVVVFDTFGYALGAEDLPVLITQKRAFPNGFVQINTYRIKYRTIKQDDGLYYDTMQYHVPYINNHVPGSYPIEDNPDENET